MEYTRLDTYITSATEELLKDLKTLIHFDSEANTPTEGAPFGKEAAACLTVAAKIIENNGFSVINYDNYAIAADFDAGLEKGLDILAHLDVVPAGSGWSVTLPFEMKQVGNRVYGRGSIDDKGPALCVLYAMKAIKACGIQLQKNVRLILGSDEECDGRDLEYYFAREQSAPYSLSPDADFPLIHIEKGGLQLEFHSHAALGTSFPRVTALHAGVKINVVPEFATATIEGMSPLQIAKIADTLSFKDCTFSYQEQGDCTIVNSHGKNAHASTPHDGANALTALLALLHALPLSAGELHAQLDALAELFPHGDFHGKALGVDLQDEPSGKTTLSLDILHLSAEGLRGAFDCRTCLSANDENTTAVAKDKLQKAGFIPAEDSMYPPHHVPEESFLVQTLMRIYNDMSGQQARPLCIGGGTYVHDIKNGVAFGCCFPELDNHLHGADEFITLEQIVFSTKIYVRAILALCGTADHSSEVFS